MPERIYLDHAATTPLRPEAEAAMRESFALWANPSSPHAEGRKARAALEDARARVKAALGWEGELIFTSGASEALAIGLARARAGARLVSAVEHDAVFNAVSMPVILPVRDDGLIEDESLWRALDANPNPLLVAQTVNSETGVNQDVGAMAEYARDRRGLLLSDASQSAGKYDFLPYEYAADMIVISGHKFGGPVGIGALLVKDFGMLEPSGGQERGYRRGTENLPGAMGMAAALEASKHVDFADDVWDPLLDLAEHVRALGGTWINGQSGYIQSIAMPGISGDAQLVRFDMAGISVSRGSACSSGSLKKSRVLEAMGLDPEVAERVIRVSLGWNTTREEVERFCETWIAMAREAVEKAA